MSYDGKIMRRALARFDEDKQRRDAAFEQRRDALYARVPRLKEIEQELKGTLPQIIASALRRGTDPKPAINVLRDSNLELQRERAELLALHGYDADYLDEQPHCVLCRDSDYCGDAVCRCLREYYAREQIAELSKLLKMGSETFETFAFHWYSPERGSYRRSPRETAEHNFDVCQDYAHQFSPRSGNLLLFGAPGLGKTFLSTCIARVVSENGHSVVYDTAANIFNQFEADKFRHDEEDAAEDVKRYMECDLLIVDDLGTEMTTAFVQSVVYQLINGRLMAGKKTIINTNLDPDEIGKRYGAQVLSRIEGEYEILPFAGEDIRKLKREK